MERYIQENVDIYTLASHINKTWGKQQTLLVNILMSLKN